MNTETITPITDIFHQNGDLMVKTDGNRFWWGISDLNTTHWVEIPESLYREIIAYERTIHEPPAS